MGKTKAQTGTPTASYCHNSLRRTASKQLLLSHEVPLPEASGHSLYSWETADQHCFKVTFAQITFIATFNCVT